MAESSGGVLLYILAATGAGILGGLIALFWKPAIGARSAIQHFAAGVVIAAVASDVIPEVEKVGTPLGILAGFAAGGAFMIALKYFVLRFEKQEARRGKQSVGLSVAAAFDTLVDGAIISAGFSAGHEVGSLLAVALSIELLFLTLSVGSEFHSGRRKRWTGLAVTTGVALMLPIGALFGRWALAGASEATVAAVLAFGAAALIYLIAEELLVESIQAEENLFSTAMLFAGFLVVLALKILAPEAGEV
jgi:ZIP family zinc transporter